MGPSRASQSLKRWLAVTGNSQVWLAERLTEVLGREGRPVNQSTVSSWSRGAGTPGGPGMVALQEITGIPVTDWILPPEEEESGSSLSDAAHPKAS